MKMGGGGEGREEATNATRWMKVGRILPPLLPAAINVPIYKQASYKP